MSQSAITLAFENYKAQEAINGQVLKLNEFVLANVPGLDPSLPVDRNETVPSDEYIVHRQAVSKEGVVNQNTVAYSITMGSDVGDFDFNWLGLRNKETGLLGMVVHVPTQRKIATAAGQQGNALTRSFLMEYDGAAEATEITTPAESWQIDFTARLFGIDDVQRLVNRDLYGAGAFFGDSFLVTKSGSVYSVTAGVGYIGGLRAELSQNQLVNVTTLPTKIWADVSYQGTVTSDWQTVISLISAETMVDYVDRAGFAHYVFAVAAIDSVGAITDLRPKGSVPTQESQNAIKELTDALALHEKSRNHPDASLLEKGMVRLSNATNSSNEDEASTPKATKIAMDNANARLAKERNLADLTNPAQARLNLQLGNSATKNIGTTAGSVAAGDDDRIVGAMQKALNGADISDKQEFINNVGLRDTVNKADSAYPGVKYFNEPPGREYIGAFSCGKDSNYVKGLNVGSESSDCAQLLVDANGELLVRFLNGNGVVKENIMFNGTKLFDSLPERDYFGAFACGVDGSFVRGISIGLTSASDVGQLWIDSSANLHTRFLNSNGDVQQNKIIGIPIGATIEWQTTAPIPAGFLANEGRSFSATAYPELAKVFPDLKLPDDRGLFKRGLDNGKGIDPNRRLGTVQDDAMRNITGSINGITAEPSGVAASGAFTSTYKSGGRAAGSGAGLLGFDFNASRVVPVASEFRPKNKATIYITRVL